ncbi:hypothetical protein ACIBEJ_48170 [Nonomuraea sp. NPDC050790]|uniref:hypothetical protein n=1 Tax=Nonomuraea sp. NPDC050790 TaxID=3364371 RepID=UPI0037A4B6B7
MMLSPLLAEVFSGSLRAVSHRATQLIGGYGRGVPGGGQEQVDRGMLGGSSF